MTGSFKTPADLAKSMAADMMITERFAARRLHAYLGDMLIEDEKIDKNKIEAIVGGNISGIDKEVDKESDDPFIRAEAKNIIYGTVAAKILGIGFQKNAEARAHAAKLGVAKMPSSALAQKIRETQDPGLREALIGVAALRQGRSNLLRALTVTLEKMPQGVELSERSIREVQRLMEKYEFPVAPHNPAIRLLPPLSRLTHAIYELVRRTDPAVIAARATRPG